MRIAAACMAAVAIAFLAGCSSHKATVQTQSGDTTITTGADNKSVTVETSEGTVAVGQTPDPAKLGAPIYPGAQSKDSGSISSSGNSGSSVIAAFKTADDFDKVYGYYKQQLPGGSEKMKMSTSSGSIATFQIGEEQGPDEVTVQISADKPGETDILITHVTKTGSP